MRCCASRRAADRSRAWLGLNRVGGPAAPTSTRTQTGSAPGWYAATVTGGHCRASRPRRRPGRASAGRGSLSSARWTPTVAQRRQAGRRVRKSGTACGAGSGQLVRRRRDAAKQDPAGVVDVGRVERAGPGGTGPRSTSQPRRARRRRRPTPRRRGPGGRSPAGLRGDQCPATGGHAVEFVLSTVCHWVSLLLRKVRDQGAVRCWRTGRPRLIGDGGGGGARAGARALRVQQTRRNGV